MLWPYCPVSVEARDGQQSGVVTMKSVKEVPPFASSRNVLGIVRRLSWARVWSSVRIRTMFGPSECGRSASGGAE